MNITTGQLLQYLQDGGVLGLLVFILVAGFKRWWVFGRELSDYKEQAAQVLATALAQADAALAASRAETLEWKTMALKGIEANERALEVARIAQTYRPAPTP